MGGKAFLAALLPLSGGVTLLKKCPLPALAFDMGRILAHNRGQNNPP
jgi:hypothetical protein